MVSQSANTDVWPCSQEYCDLCGDRYQGVPYSPSGRFQILKCPRCGLLWTSPLLTHKPIFVGEEVYLENADKQKERFREQVRLFLRITGLPALPGLRVLEVGSGLGFFLDVCEELGIGAEGCDTAPQAVAYANRNRRRVREGTLDAQYQHEAFDAVFAFNLIEHLPHPSAFLREVHRVLKPDGTLVLETPTQDSLFHRLGRLGDLCSRGALRLYGMGPSGHIYKFCGKTFRSLLNSKFELLYEKNVGSPWCEIWGNSSRVRLQNRRLYRLALPLAYSIAGVIGQENRTMVMLRKCSSTMG